MYTDCKRYVSFVLNSGLNKIKQHEILHTVQFSIGIMAILINFGIDLAHPYIKEIGAIRKKGGHQIESVYTLSDDRRNNYTT